MFLGSSPLPEAAVATAFRIPTRPYFYVPWLADFTAASGVVAGGTAAVAAFILAFEVWKLVRFVRGNLFASEAAG
jgi:hypothetical protein